jgi:hypothetical protein
MSENPSSSKASSPESSVDELSGAASQNGQRLPKAPLGQLEGVSQLMSGLSEPSMHQTALPLTGSSMDVWECADHSVDQPEGRFTEASHAERQVSEMDFKTDSETIETHPVIVEREFLSTASENPTAEGQVLSEGPILNGEQPETLQLEVAQSLEATPASPREVELLALIHDLNECNDVLLSRIAQMEASLEHAQGALRAESENAKVAQERLSQQVSQAAQQQVAKLVAQLESTEQALSRQQLINENLSTELSNGQERIAQLERESALIAQQHAEQAQALVKAETASRDLRSRLQRQQRYTLQFKAALEKSLSVSSERPANVMANSMANGMGMSVAGMSATAMNEIARPVSFQERSGAMPKAQRIMPWAASTSSPFQGIDPHLETLIRRAAKPDEVTAKSAMAKPAEGIARAASPEAEAELWQDLERVMENASEAQPAALTDGLAAMDAVEVTEGFVAAGEMASEIASKMTGKMANEITSEMKSAEAETSEAPVEAVAVAIPEQQGIEPFVPGVASSDAIAREKLEAISLSESFAIAASQRAEKPVGFTEPSPWRSPLDKQVLGKNPLEKKLPTVPAPEGPAVRPDYLPVLDDASTISPIVKPLRAQKRIGSMSAVELPTFPGAKASSFKR